MGDLCLGSEDYTFRRFRALSPNPSDLSFNQSIYIYMYIYIYDIASGS